MGRNCHGPKSTWADFVMGRNDPEPTRRLLKSVQNPEILICNNMSVNIRLFYKHFLYEKKIVFLIDAENFNAKN